MATSKTHRVELQPFGSSALEVGLILENQLLRGLH